MFKKLFNQTKKSNEKTRDEAIDDCPMCKIDPAILQQLSENKDNQKQATNN